MYWNFLAIDGVIKNQLDRRVSRGHRGGSLRYNIKKLRIVPIKCGSFREYQSKRRFFFLEHN
jgi:hypothetical protein